MKLLAPLAALVLSLLIFFGYLAHSYPLLPERIATHFDLQGQPNGWMGREGFIAFTVGMGIFLTAVIVGITGATRWLPVNCVNIPHRDYWLAPERRTTSSALLFRFGLWLASLSLLLLTGVQWLIVQANLPESHQRLDPVHLAGIVGPFLFGTILWIVLLKRTFSRPD